MSDVYRELVLDHWRNPRKSEVLTDATHQLTVVNETCGDEVAVQLLIADDIIQDVSIQTQGCALATASGSILATHLVDLTTKELSVLTEKDIRRWLGDIDPLIGRTNCLTLALVTAQQAIKVD